ncbi:Hypp1708 [Branchiostoma lanceolatum]|uniref:Hypp1708 protein n=1 Tax=Branchiostoma lanceolatum TaxID=7740 RepID=A0A8K0EPE1_BRALA|nr:Hypp1708 [Branchiostoma lanceolatum]
MSAACNLLTTFPLWWTHLVAFASGGVVFAAVFYCSGRLFSRLSPAFCSLDTKKQDEVRLQREHNGLTKAARTWAEVAAGGDKHVEARSGSVVVN